MKCEIILTNLRSTWHSSERENATLLHIGKVLVEGTFISDGSSLLDLLDRIDIKDKQSVEAMLAGIDGFFSIIFENEQGVLAIGDRVRSYPLFFALSPDTVVISDNAREIQSQCSLDSQNDRGVLEFLLCGYVTGNETLYENLGQLLPGQYLLFDKETGDNAIYEYFQYCPVGEEENDITRQRELEHYRALMKGTFERLRDLIIREGYQPVVPLSGGRDSRLMAILLKEQGFDNTVCYTFGRKNHPEVIKSRAIAESLGFDWLFVPYTGEKWYREYQSTISHRYMAFCDGLCVKPHLMEFIAVKELFSGKAAKCLFLPGHSLDFIAGSHVPQSLIAVNSPTTRDLYTSVIGKHFCFHHVYSSDRQVIMERIHDELSTCSLITRGDLIGAFEYWDWRERQGKLILNSLNVYDFFGFDWYVPFWEMSWMNFFSDLPYDWRYKQNFHRVAMNALYPDHFQETEWIQNGRSIPWERINLLRKYPLTTALIRYFNKIAGRNYASLSQDYGLQRYGAFQPRIDNLEGFVRKYASCTDIKRIFYFFAFDYLVKNNFCLDFLDERYKRSASPLIHY